MVHVLLPVGAVRVAVTAAVTPRCLKEFRVLQMSLKCFAVAKISGSVRFEAVA